MTDIDAGGPAGADRRASAAPGPGSPESCPFCTMPVQRIVLANDLAYAVRDLHPVSDGHLLVIPRRHIPNWWQADDAERSALSALLDEAKASIDAQLHPDGYNIGSNDGAAAGQTVFHLHIHLIPRRESDTHDPRGGVRHVIPQRGNYLAGPGTEEPGPAGAAAVGPAPQDASPSADGSAGAVAVAGAVAGGGAAGGRVRTETGPGVNSPPGFLGQTPGEPASPVHQGLLEALGPDALVRRAPAILDEGRRSATYKPALLLALVELATERAESDSPLTLPLADVAERVMELYWPQTRPHPAATDGSLRQVRGTRSRIIGSLRDLRRTSSARPGEPLGRVARTHPAEFGTARASVARALALQPVPRLQRPGSGFALGGDYPRFLYDDRNFVAERGWVGSGDPVIVLTGAAATALAAGAPLLRMAAEDRWTAQVANLNHIDVERTDLRRFLFGAQRTSLAPVADALRDLGVKDCFWCDQPLRGNVEVDHVIPWSHFPNDDLFNLVLTDRGCNNDRRDRLVSGDLVSAWAQRDAQALRAAADAINWPMDPTKSAGVARSAYRYLPDGIPVWIGRRRVLLFDDRQRRTVADALSVFVA